MHYLWIAFTLVLGLVDDTNAQHDFGDQNDNMDGESLPSKLLERRTQQADENHFFEISIGIIVDDARLCSGDEMVSMDDDITQLLIDYQFGDVGDDTDQASGICDNSPPTDPYEEENETTFAYRWFRSGACTFCGTYNADQRMLATTAEALSATVKNVTETILIPNHPTCFGLEWTVQVTVKEVTAAAIEVYCDEILSMDALITEPEPEPVNETSLLPVEDHTLITEPARPAEWEYELPEWWDIVKEHEGDDDLKKCKGREDPPRHGKKCKRTKTCYWGNQQCDDDFDEHLQSVSFPYATTSCHCDGKKKKNGRWSCEPVACPKIK